MIFIKIFLFQICSIFTVSTTLNHSLPLELIKDFFKLKYIKEIDFHTCDSNYALKLMRFLNNEFILNVNIPQSLLNIRENRHYRIGIFVDLSCKSNLEFLKQASLNLFTISYEWLILIPYESDLLLLDNSGIDVSSQVTVVTYDSILFDLYRPNVNTLFNITEVGNWSNLNGVQYTSLTRVYNFNRSPIFGGYFYFNPIIFQYKNNTKLLQDRAYYSSDDTTNRYSYALHLLLADLYNYSMELAKTDTWGDPRPNNHYSGILGQLQTGEANVSMTLMLMLPQRLAVGDHLIPLLKYWKTFAFKQPRALGTHQALLLPLMPTVWITLIMSLVTASVIYYTLHKNDNETFSECVILFVGIFTQQGLTKDPRTMSGRLICLTMLIMASLVMLYYNGAAMSALLSSTPPKINKLDQLIASNIPLALMDAPYFNNKEVRARLLSKKLNKKIDMYWKRTFGLDDGLKIVLKGGAFCAEFFTVYEGINRRFKDSQKCDLTYIPAYHELYLTAYVPKKSPLRELFMRGFLSLREFGLMDREKNKWIAGQPKCAGKEQFLFVSLEAVTIALASLLGGVIVSIAVFICEMFSSKRKRIHKESIEGCNKMLKNDTSIPTLIPIIH